MDDSTDKGLEEILDSLNLGTLVDAVFGGRGDESGRRVSSPFPSKPDIVRAVNRAFDTVFATISPREEVVLKLLYGLDGSGLKRSRKEVGQLLDVTSERVRQIEAKALRKLHHPARSRVVRNVLEEVLEAQSIPFSPPAELLSVIEKIKKLTPELIAHLRSHNDDLIKIHPLVFEHLIAEFFASWGFDDVRLVGRNPKTSADIYVAKVVNPVGMETRYFIEVKRWNRKVGIEVINQVLGAMIGEKEQFGWHAAMIVTVAGFTDFEKWDRQQLKLKGVELKDRNDLLQWLRDYKEKRNGLWLPEPPTLI